MQTFLELRHLSKSFGSLAVLQNINLCLSFGKVYALMGSSGSGKTTLLRILMGLETADSGDILWHSSLSPSPRISVVFQEDRLCESFSPIENIRMVLPKDFSDSALLQECMHLLPEESLFRPVSTLSGGMKRRTAILRAVLCPSDFLLFDEPFTGLDETTKHFVIRYILEKAENRTILFTTHNKEEISLMGAELLFT